MTIRVWFGVNVNYDQQTPFNKSLDHLLTLYAEAITQYFGLRHVRNVNELISAARTNNLDVGASMFLDWFERTGINEIKETITYAIMPDSTIINEIDYESYVLTEEMGFDYPEEVRSLLISIVTDFLPKVKKMAECRAGVSLVFYSFQETATFETPLTSGQRLDLLYQQVSYDAPETATAQSSFFCY